ncbi:MAG TPA: class I SAM-dependent methyltransferase [Pyrinomonadaceae bacterium]|jgi:SAM-dependent methyltransferase|nr:class I SAM-dependent methyltransferase [Pyrinomonadaceae bacterium]
MTNETSDERARARELAAEFAARGDMLGWFEALYKEAAGNNEHIPWADLEPNRFLAAWAHENKLEGNGRTALVVGCGLGDDAKFLAERGFKVTAFDISETAIEWAKKLHADSGAGFHIDFHAADLFNAPPEWENAFEFVLEVYTIQPLPLEMRPQVIDAIAGFVKPGGELLVVCRGREDTEEPDQLPWPLSRHDLARFEHNGLKQISFTKMFGDEEEPEKRFVVKYKKETGHELL